MFERDFKDALLACLGVLLLILALLTISYDLRRNSMIDQSNALRDCRLRGQVDRHWCDQQLSKCDERWD